MSDCSRCAERRKDHSILCALMLTDYFCPATYPVEEPEPLVTDLIAALRAARERLAIIFNASGHDPACDSTIRDIDAAIERATTTKETR